MGRGGDGLKFASDYIKFLCHFIVSVSHVIVHVNIRKLDNCGNG